LQLKKDADDLKQELVEGANYDKEEEEIIDPEKIRRENRNSLIEEMDQKTDLSHTKIGEVVGLTQQSVSRLLNSSA
jgi:DNA-directed RNA polymerase specialized sigma subunit